MKLLVIIPTYNEMDNISKIIPAVFSRIPDDAGILIVDDGSPDGTANAVKKLLDSYTSVRGGGYSFWNGIPKKVLLMHI